MAIPQEALDIINEVKTEFEEERRKKQKPLTDEELGLKLAKEERKQPTTFISKIPKEQEEAIPVWTKKGKIEWKFKPLTPKMEEQINLAKEIKLLRQTADLGDRAEAFVQGILPVGDKEIYEKAFPISNLGGHLTRLIGTGYMTAPIVQPIYSGLMGMQLPYTVSQSLPRMVAFATQRALTYGADKVSENITRGVTGGEPLGIKTLFKEPLKEAGFGAIYGIAHGVTGAEAASTISGAISGSRVLIRKYYNEGKITKQDMNEAFIMTAFTGLVEYWGHDQIIRQWKDKEFQDFMINKEYNKLRSLGDTHEEALTGAYLKSGGLFTDISGHNQAIYEQVIKPNLPEEINNLSQTLKSEFIQTVKEKITNHIPISQAIGDTLQQFQDKLTSATMQAAPKLLPLFGKQEVKKPKEKTELVTPNQMRYGKELEKILIDTYKFSEEDIKVLKDNKSFSKKKENAMTPMEAGRVIRDYENLIEDQATLFQGEENKKILKQMDVLRAKHMKSFEKGIFENIIAEDIPVELQDDIGARFYTTDMIRPTWRIFRKDPVMNKHGYIPMSDAYGMTQRFAEASILEARRKTKELKLTPEERRRVTIKRHVDYFYSIGQDLGIARPELNDREKQWDDWLTSHFEGLHKFFNLSKQIPYDKYIPLLSDLDEAEGGLINEFLERMPKNITAFFEYRRQSKKAEKFREDSLELYEMYIRAGAKRKYMLPAIRQARRFIIQNRKIDAAMKSHFQDWGVWLMGYPSMADAEFTAIFKKMGLKYDMAYKTVRTMMNLVYMGGIGLRPQSALRNLLQSMSTASELGYRWTAEGLSDFLLNGWSRLEDKGVFIEYMPELYSELGEMTQMQKLRDAFLFLYRNADKINRSIAYLSSEHKFNHYFKKFGNTEKFYQKSGINFIDKPKRIEIKQLMNEGKIDKALEKFAKEIVSKTQYLYKKETSPLIQKNLLGKMFFQFKSWPENYLELLLDWGRNKNYAAFVRALLMYAALGYLGNKVGQKWLTRSIPLGTLPIDQWRYQRLMVPATLGPAADMLELMFGTLNAGLETQDPEVMQRRFKKALKNLGNDALLYIPGGLAMKDLYKIRDIIPFRSGTNQELNKYEFERFGY